MTLKNSTSVNINLNKFLKIFGKEYLNILELIKTKKKLNQSNE